MIVFIFVYICLVNLWFFIIVDIFEIIRNNVIFICYGIKFVFSILLNLFVKII